MQEILNSFFLTKELHPLLFVLFIYLTTASVFSKNYIHSVLFLILSFLDSAFILFYFDIELLALLFIMVYVGAVAVLFLFVIMMVETKQNNYSNLNIIFKGIIIFTFFLLLIINEFINSFLNTIFFNLTSSNLVHDSILNIKTILFDEVSNITYIGKLLFNYYLIPVLISGFILIVALIGSISLTFDYKKIIENKSKQQLSRNYLNATNLFRNLK